MLVARDLHKSLSSTANCQLPTGKTDAGGDSGVKMGTCGNLLCVRFVCVKGYICSGIRGFIFLFLFLAFIVLRTVYFTVLRISESIPTSTELIIYIFF